MKWIKRNRFIRRLYFALLRMLPDINLQTKDLEKIRSKFVNSLNDKTDEFESYNKLPIETLSRFAAGKTVASGYYSKLISDYAAANNLPEIEAADIDFSRLPDVCHGKDTLIIANPALSALLITTPALLLETAQNLNRNLILVVWAYNRRKTTGIHQRSISLCKDHKLYLNDNFIRRMLHQNGFYDVSSIAYANHGLSRREIAKTRYEYPSAFHIVDSADECIIYPDEIMCYCAYRLRRTDSL